MSESLMGLLSHRRGQVGERPPWDRWLIIGLLLSLCMGGASALWSDGARLYKSGPIQITLDGATVWVANRDNDSISRLTTATDAVSEFVLPSLPNGSKHQPLGLAVLDDGSEVWVACHDSDRVLVYSAAGSLIDQIDLPWGTGPFSVAFSPPINGTQTSALVTGYRGGTVTVVDTATRSIVSTEPVYKTPMGIAFVQDPGLAAWVTHLVADGEHNRMSRIDLGVPNAPRTTTELRVTPVQPQDSASTGSRPAEGGYVSPRGHPAAVPGGVDGGRLWVPVQYQNIHNTAPDVNSAVQAVIRKVDLIPRLWVAGSNLPSNPQHPAKIILSAESVHAVDGSNSHQGDGWDAGVSGAIDVGFSSDGNMAYVLFEQSEDLLFVPTSTTPIKPPAAAALVEEQVGRRPTGLVTSPVADLAWVYNSLFRSVSVVDLAAQSELRTVAVTPTTGEPFQASFLRGAEIFHSSNEAAISSNAKVACASCHMNAEADGRGWDFQHLPGNHGPRETVSLLGLGRTYGAVDPTTGWGQIHRSGDRDEVQDFEHTFRGVHMGGSGFIAAGPHPELGTANAGRSSDLDALATYLLGLEPAPRSPYRDPAGNLTRSATRGAVYFRGDDPLRAADAACASCHDPATGFTDLAFHDVGQAVRPGENELNNRIPANHVNTLGLHGLWLSAPYGGIVSWAEDLPGALLDFRNRSAAASPHGRLGGLTQRQLRDLEEFLVSIDGDLTAAVVSGAEDDQPPRIERIALTSPTRLEVFFDEGVTEASVENLSAWSIHDPSRGTTVAVTSATWDAQNGDRVTLGFAPLASGCVAPQQYQLEPLGPFNDLADTASGGIVNTATNLAAVPFDLGGELTITLGASGYDHITVRVHDAATIPNLTNWSHGSVWIFPNGSTENTGLVRFEWADAFEQATGVVDASDILDASIQFLGDLGESQTVEARRVLQRWFDVGHSDFTSNPSAGGQGGPTWRSSEHGVRLWNSNNARRTSAGINGTHPSHYFGSNDTAHQVEATLEMQSINRRQALGGAGVLDAFRFWFDNRGYDFGYALRVTSSSVHQTRLLPAEANWGLDGPRLVLTYDTGCEVLFGDDFESGDLAAWSASSP